MPGVGHVTEVHPDGSDHVLVHLESGSWARAYDTGEASVAVAEAGPRNLWAELGDVAQAWEEAGGLPISAYGLTVDSRGGHTLWAASPDGHRWPLG